MIERTLEKCPSNCKFSKFSHKHFTDKEIKSGKKESFVIKKHSESSPFFSFEIIDDYPIQLPE
jgi:hypothetical protein